jgi:hypothetical protein
MTTTQTKRLSRALIIRLIGTLISVILLVYLLSQQGWSEIGSAIRQIPAWRILVAVGLTFVSRLAVSLRWHVLLRAAGVAITPGQTTRLTFAGLFASNFLPTTIGGDVARLAGAIQLKFDAAIAAASLVVDRLVGMAGMALVLPVGIPRMIQAGFVFTTFFAPISMSSATFIRIPVAVQSLLRKFRVAVVTVGEALRKWLHQPGALMASLVFTGVHMLCLYASIWLLLIGLGETISFWLVAGLWSAVYFITLIPISINGYGLQEVSMAVIFAQAGGVTHQSSLTIALLVRTLTMLGSLPGALYLPGIMAGQKKSPESGESPSVLT